MKTGVERMDGTEAAGPDLDPLRRLVPTAQLRGAYLHYAESRNPTAPTFVALEDGLELGIVSGGCAAVARAVSSLLTRSLEGARCDRGGHLPTAVVRRVQRDIISPAGVADLWGSFGHRFVLARRWDETQHEVVATLLVARRKGTVFFFTGRYNNVRHSAIMHTVDFNQLDDDGQHRWFDRFAFPPPAQFKPLGYHHIANFVVGPEQRSQGLSRRLLAAIRTYYARDYMEAHGLPIVHAQYLLCGRGFWQIGDPPWLARMQRLGFFLRWGAESFFLEQPWAPLPPVVVEGRVVDHLSYNRSYGLPMCYGADRVPHPAETHLFDRVPEVLRLAADPRAKLQYFQALFDFI